MNGYLVFLFGIYCIGSKYLFDKVFGALDIVIDEEFHLPLGEKYCRFKFDEWDPKVTTLPGLYIFSSIILGPWNLCSTYWLRFTSLLFSALNFILIYIILSSTIKEEGRRILAVLSCILLPPLYFFSHVYYTDTVSLSANLLVILLCESGYHYFATIAGFVAVCCRQTNIVFVSVFAGKYILNELYRNWAKNRRLRLKKKGITSNKLGSFIKDTITNPLQTTRNLPKRFWLNFTSYFSLFASFLWFVWFNDGIVVGDRHSHQMTINIPQIFYFSIFCLVFSWPYFLGEVLNFFRFTKRNKTLIIISCLVGILIIHYNTVVHPYLLADNRHFVFYIWNRFYGRYWWFRYMLTPVYIFAIYVITKTIWNRNDITLFLLYIPAVFILLVTQALLEFRYFIVPFLIFKIILLMKNRNFIVGIADVVSYFVINYATFSVFFSKTFYWNDFPNPQRIVW